MRLLILAPYPQRTAPSQRFRFEQYLGRLAGHGIDAEVRSLTSGRPGGGGPWAGARIRTALGGAVRRVEDVLRCGRYDAVMVHREAYPVGPPLVERAIHRRGIPLIFDFDDAIYLPNVSDENRRLAWMKMPSKVEAIVAVSDLVIAGNRELADWAGARSRNVRVIPTTIDTDLYRPRPDPAPSRDRVCIGWSGSRTTIEHLETVAGALRELQATHGVRLRVIGDARFRIEGAEVTATDWREETELRDLGEIDIGIMPLPDDRWARGKCGLKALQYMALAIPTVMSPVGVNAEIAAAGAALLARDGAEWARALGGLVADPGERRRLGAAGRQRVLERYSTDANEEAFVAALESVAS